jgi:glycopeptide antibiotics resistance protein
MKNFFASNRIIRKILGLSLFTYLLVVGWFLFISVDSINRNTYFKKREIHVVPFKNTYISFKSLHQIANIVPPDQVPYYRYLLIRNIIGNIALLIPIGFLVPLLWERLNTLKAIVIFSVLCSFSIEIIQYILIIGVFDIDDIIYNLIGAVIGFCVLRAFQKYIPNPL